MRPLFTALVLASTVATATEVTVNASEGRHPIPTDFYAGALGDEAHQAELIDAHGLGLPVGDLARVALLGILGRDGLVDDWPATPEQTAALKVFTNYDGAGGRFGDTSIVTTSTSDGLLAFAAYDADARVTVLLVNAGSTGVDETTVGLKGMGQKGGWRAFALGADGKLGLVGEGTTYDALIRHPVAPNSALVIEYAPVGGILPLPLAPLPDIGPAVGDALPAAQPSAEDPQPQGCSTVAGPFAWVAVLLIAIRWATLGQRF